MAHSVQVFQGRGEVFNDLDLMVLFMFLSEVGVDLSDRPYSQWKHTLVHYGPGTIHLSLDEMTESEVARFLVTLGSIRELLNSFGEVIPGQLLCQRNITPGVVFSKSFHVRHVLEAAIGLEKLVSVRAPIKDQI